MARKRQVFQMIRDDIDETPPDHATRPDRAANRRERDMLAALAARMILLPDGRRKALPLEPLVAAELETLRRLKPSPAHRRQINRVVGLLRTIDLDAILAELDGDGPAAVRLNQLERWRRRILTEGDTAIQEFVDRHDHADRSTLRALARQARGDSPAALRAAKKLFQALKQAEERPQPDP